MTDDQLDWAEAAYTVIVALEQEVAAAEAQRVGFGARQNTPPDFAHTARTTPRPPALNPLPASGRIGIGSLLPRGRTMRFTFFVMTVSLTLGVGISAAKSAEQPL